MTELISTVINKIPKDATPVVTVLFILIASFLYALSKANVIYDFLDKFNKRKFTRLRDLLDDENISENVKRSLQDKINLIAYQKITGIKTNNIYLQEQIIQYYKLSKGRLKYSDFKRAFTLLKIDSNDILTIRIPNIYERIFHIYWIFASILTFVFFSFLLVVLIYFSMYIRQKIGIFMMIVGSGAMLVTFAYQASLIPTAKRIRDELKNNPFIIQRNKKILELRQTDLKHKQLKSNEIPFTVKDEEVIEKTSTTTFHPLAHFSMEERQNLIKKVLGAWQNEPEINAIFAEIDRDRHNTRGRQIDSLDN